MTTLHDYLEPVRAMRRDCGDTPLQPILHVEVDGRLTAVIWPNGPMEKIVAVAATAAHGMHASALTLAVDCRVHYAEGDMEHPAEVTADSPMCDAVTVVRVERGSGGRGVLQTLPYRVAAGTVDFIPTPWQADGDELMTGGPLAETLSDAVNNLSIMDEFAVSPLASDLGSEELNTSSALLRAMTVKVLLGIGCEVALHVYDEQEAKVYADALGSDPSDFHWGDQAGRLVPPAAGAPEKPEHDVTVEPVEGGWRWRCASCRISRSGYGSDTEAHTAADKHAG